MNYTEYHTLKTFSNKKKRNSFDNKKPSNKQYLKLKLPELKCFLFKKEKKFKINTKIKIENLKPLKSKSKDKFKIPQKFSKNNYMQNKNSFQKKTKNDTKKKNLLNSENQIKPNKDYSFQKINDNEDNSLDRPVYNVSKYNEYYSTLIRNLNLEFSDFNISDLFVKIEDINNHYKISVPYDQKKFLTYHFGFDSDHGMIEIKKYDLHLINKKNKLMRLKVQINFFNSIDGTKSPYPAR